MRTSLLILVAAFSLTACRETPGVNSPAITESQAIDRIEQLIHDAVARLKPKPELELYRPSLNPARCVGPTDQGSEERIVINRRYYLRGIPKEEAVAIAEQIKSQWEQQGHLVTSTHGFDIGRPDISGRSRPDDFLLSLSWTEGDRLGIGATSPCIWPNGTSHPS